MSARWPGWRAPFIVEIANMFSRLKSILLSTFIVIFTMTSAQASVTLLGSRIIYPAQATSVDIQFKNNDNIPYVIQSWFDDGDVDSQPQQKNNVPFIVTPPVFRIQPKAGQIARVIFSGTATLPQDRESLFWFNTLQIPPSQRGSQAKQNIMTVMLRNRVKVFYRPAVIGKPDNILKGVKVNYVFDARKGSGLEIDNAQPWHLSLVALSLKTGAKNMTAETQMIAPYSKKTFWLSNAKQRFQGAATATLAAINDQGARISEDFAVNSQQR